MAEEEKKEFTCGRCGKLCSVEKGDIVLTVDEESGVDEYRGWCSDCVQKYTVRCQLCGLPMELEDASNPNACANLMGRRVKLENGEKALWCWFCAFDNARQNSDGEYEAITQAERDMMTKIFGVDPYTENVPYFTKG